MAKRENKAEPSRRTARAGEISAVRAEKHGAYNAHKTSWEKQKNRRAEGLAKQRWFIDGRHLTKYLTELATITGDERFTAFAAVIEEYGLTADGPAKQCKALAGRLRPPLTDLDLALEVMCIMEREAIKAGKKFNASDCAVPLVSEYALPGPSFEKTVERLRKAFGALDDSWRPARSLGKKR